jgi:hypothetical protein
VDQNEKMTLSIPADVKHDIEFVVNKLNLYRETRNGPLITLDSFMRALARVAAEIAKDNIDELCGASNEKELSRRMFLMLMVQMQYSKTLVRWVMKKVPLDDSFERDGW